LSDPRFFVGKAKVWALPKTGFFLWNEHVIEETRMLCDCEWLIQTFSQGLSLLQPVLLFIPLPEMEGISFRIDGTFWNRDDIFDPILFFDINRCPKPGKLIAVVV